LLSDESGRAVADHQVDLDEADPLYAAFNDLYRYLAQHRVPTDWVGSEASIVDAVGAWVGRHVLGGRLGAALTGTVRVIVPTAADFLLDRPLELGHVQGVPLARRGVALVLCLQPPQGSSATAAAKAPVSDRLRILALFSMPSRASVLALRRERYELAKTVREVAARYRKKVELRVLQYGVTRQRLAETVEEEPGWDVLHISGHGGRGVLLLEHSDGSPDTVSTSDLVTLLSPARARLKLAVLAACDSGASAAATTLRNLDLTEAAATTLRDLDSAEAAEQVEQLPQPPAAGSTVAAGEVGLARGLVDQLGVAVLAMRYPVMDTFAVELTRELYPLLLRAGRPIDTAITLALPRAAGEAASAGRPALSVGTPALFGASAVGLTVAPPPGDGEIDVYAERMAAFPPEAPRFVGRTPALIAASRALAPDSGKAGVLFVGMAGAGKTACAVELAHQHRGRFGRLAWWQAPTQPDEFAQALSLLADAMEAQLGIPMMAAIASPGSLRSFLPRLSALLREEALLLVLDNLETLLSDARAWRDPLFGLLLDGLTGHGGLSRVVLTSRVAPADGRLDRLLQLPTHALSLTESVLLARELPNLARLLHDEPAPERSATQISTDRDLARQVLHVVQGHPKLLELADAAARDPAQLTARLLAADSVAAGSTRLDAFFSTGVTGLDGEQFLRVLGAWTTAALAALPEPARLTAQLLAGIDDDDRQTPILDAVWPLFWGEHHPDRPTPRLDETLAGLHHAAIIDAQPRDPADPDSATVLGLHPGVADTIRADLDSHTVATITGLLANFWVAIYEQAAELEEQGRPVGSLIVRAGLSAAPYLLHQRRWYDAGMLLERAVQRDQSPAVARQVLGYLQQILDKDPEPGQRSRYDGLYAFVLGRIDPAAAQTRLRHIIDTASDNGQPQVASSAAGSLVNLLRRRGDLPGALAAAAEKAKLTRLAGLGPWTQALDDAQQLQILNQIGQYREVLDQTTTLLAHLDTLPAQAGPNETAVPWNVRETVLDTAHAAAIELEDWTQALDLNQQILRSTQQRGAPAHEEAFTLFNNYGPLLRLGRLDEAERVLLSCQQVYHDHGDIVLLSRVYTARADLEATRGQYDQAIGLVHTALRYAYHRPEPEDVAAHHNNLASYLNLAGRKPTEAVAHRLAAALLNRATGRVGGYATTLKALARDLHRGADLPPASLEQIITLVDAIAGVHFGQFFAALVPDPQTRENLLTDTINAAQAEEPDERDAAAHVDRWQPVIAVVVAATRGDSEAIEAIQSLIDELASTADWARLANAITAIIGGVRDIGQLDGLDDIDTAIVHAILAQLPA
jgi:tetratricopeptide (TPR) repeat protein